MQCLQCNKRIPNDLEACWFCGTSLTAQSAAPGNGSQHIQDVAQGKVAVMVEQFDGVANKFCMNCGIALPPDANYCLKCGKQVTRPAEDATHAPAPPAAQEAAPTPLTLLAEHVQSILFDHARRKSSLPEGLVSVSSEDITARTSTATTPQEMLQAVKDLTTKYPFYGAAYNSCAEAIATYPNLRTNVPVQEPARRPIQEPSRRMEQTYTQIEGEHPMYTSPRTPTADVLALVSAIGIVAGFLFMPWVSLFAFSLTGWNLMTLTSSTSNPGYGSSAQPDYGGTLLGLLIPAAGVLGLVTSIWGLRSPSSRRNASKWTLLAGLAALLPFGLIVLQLNGRTANMSVIGIGAWVTLLGAIGLVVQVFFPRPDDEIDAPATAHRAYR